MEGGVHPIYDCKCYSIVGHFIAYHSAMLPTVSGSSSISESESSNSSSAPICGRFGERRAQQSDVHPNHLRVHQRASEQLLQLKRFALLYFAYLHTVEGMWRYSSKRCFSPRRCHAATPRSIEDPYLLAVLPILQNAIQGILRNPSNQLNLVKRIFFWHLLTSNWRAQDVPI